MIRAVFVAVSLVFWLCALAAGLELWARWFAPDVPNAPATVCFSLAQARETYTSIYERYLTPWPAPMPALPPSERYAVQDHTQRHATAEARGEWALLIDRDGSIRHNYGTPPPDRPQWTARATPGSAVTGLIDAPQRAEELRSRLDGLFGGNFAPNMSFDLPAEGAASAMRMDVRFVPVRYDGTVRQAIVALRPSIWMAGGKKHFAPRAALTDNADIMMMERFTTNNLGYRGPEVVLPKPAGMLRIVCVGGSTTVSGYDDRMTYPAMLQTMLRERFPQAANRIEVVNCGIFGLLSQEELDMQPEILAMEPDIIVYYNGINDLCTHYRAWLEEDETWPTFSDRLRRALGGSVFMRRFFNAEILPRDKVFVQMIRECSMDNLEKLFTGYQAHGATVFACSFAGPEPGVLNPDERAYADTQFVPQWFFNMDLRSYTHVRNLFNRELEALCERTHAGFLPVAREQRVGFDQFTDLCHMTPKGIENKAAIIFYHITGEVEKRLGPS